MEQVSGTKKETSANWPLNTNTPTKEKFAMTTVSAPVSPSKYATDANPTLQRHHWQELACMVASHRPDWPISEILNALWISRDRQPFPDLARIALTVALDPRHPSPAGIHFVAAGVIPL